MYKLAPFLLLLTFSQCTVESPLLEVTEFQVDWFDADNSGTNTPPDQLWFAMKMSTTEPHPDDQVINEWEFSYTVNNLFGGILGGEKGINHSGVGLYQTIVIDELSKPGGGAFVSGDRIRFRYWGIDNHATQVERTHTFVVE